MRAVLPLARTCTTDDISIGTLPTSDSQVQIAGPQVRSVIRCVAKSSRSSIWQLEPATTLGGTVAHTGRFPLTVPNATALVVGGLVIWLKRQLLVKYAKRIGRKVHKRYRIAYGPGRLRHMMATLPDRRIVVGSSELADAGWMPTEQEYLDLLKPADWERFFQPASLDAILAEHVWEHLTPVEGALAARTCHRYLTPGGYLRVAVPDAFHPDPEYRSWVCVGGASPGQIGNGHHALYSYLSLGEMFEDAGFQVELYEYYDEAGTFHCRDFDVSKGKIWRSRRFDPRNANGTNRFTSVILDAVKA